MYLTCIKIISEHPSVVLTRRGRSWGTGAGTSSNWVMSEAQPHKFPPHFEAKPWQNWFNCSYITLLGMFHWISWSNTFRDILNFGLYNGLLALSLYRFDIAFLCFLFFSNFAHFKTIRCQIHRRNITNVYHIAFHIPKTIPITFEQELQFSFQEPTWLR